MQVVFTWPSPQDAFLVVQGPSSQIAQKTFDPKMCFGYVALLHVGPSAAERAEMFNAVSKASTETAELNSLSSANQALWQQAQKTMTDLIAEGLPVDSGDFNDLSAQIKYASDASNAMRVSLSLSVYLCSAS